MCITGGMNIDGRGMINQRFGPNEITCKDPSEICCINLKNTEPPSSDQKISCGHRNVDSLASRISEDTYYDEAKFGNSELLNLYLSLITCIMFRFYQSHYCNTFQASSHGWSQSLFNETI